MTQERDTSEPTPPNPEKPNPAPDPAEPKPAEAAGPAKVYDAPADAAGEGAAGEGASAEDEAAAREAPPRKESHALRNTVLTLVILGALGAAALALLPRMGVDVPDFARLGGGGVDRVAEAPRPDPAVPPVSRPENGAAPGQIAPPQPVQPQPQAQPQQQQQAQQPQPQQQAEQGQAAPQDLARIDDVAQRVTALEQTVNDQNRVDPRAVAALTERNQQLSDQLAQMQEQLDAVTRNSADAATVLKLSQRLEGAEAALRESQNRRDNVQALLLAVGQLREAVNQGAPFQAELQTLRALSGEDAAPVAEALGRHAEQGIPTRLTLQDRFRAIEPEIIRAELHAEGGGWWNETLDRLGRLVTVRRIDGEAAGQSTSAIVARAQQRLAAQDFAGALEELAALEGAAAETAAPWMADARARLAAERSLSELTSQVVARTANLRG